MILGFIYFGLFSFLQINVYGWGLMVTFSILSFPYWKSISHLNKGNIKRSLNFLVITSLIILAFIHTRVHYSKLFK